MDLDVRVALVEQRLASDAEERHVRRAELDKALTELREALTGLQSELTRYKGFVGGVMFAASCASALLGAVVVKLLHS